MAMRTTSQKTSTFKLFISEDVKVDKLAKCTYLCGAGFSQMKSNKKNCNLGTGNG